MYPVWLNDDRFSRQAGVQGARGGLGGSRWPKEQPKIQKIVSLFRDPIKPTRKKRVGKMLKGICICLWTQSMTFHLASVGRYAMFQVRFGLVGWSQLRHLVFGLWTIQPICIECTIRTATMARHNASKPTLLFPKVMWEGIEPLVAGLNGQVLTPISSFASNILIPHWYKGILVCFGASWIISKRFWLNRA